MANRSAASSPPAPARLRCAIYTRKSSEEGLEQDFNSLHAQRDACEAFVASQKREGWTLVGEMYDDGGFSGATMERPAFQRLLSDVSGSKIDVVVVYKVDRLTRSLSDFAKIVDIFSCRQPILRKGQSRPILRREVARAWAQPNDRPNEYPPTIWAGIAVSHTLAYARRPAYGRLVVISDAHVWLLGQWRPCDRVARVVPCCSPGWW
jgi:hypothetical protein